MPTVAAFLPRALLFPRPRPPSPPPLPPPLSTVVARRQFHHFPFPRLRLTKPRPLVIVASSSSSSGASFDELDSVGRSDNLSSKESILLNMVQEIEPLDVSLIQKDVPAKTVDAMKRTISGMLGLLPSDQFHVLVEALWEPLFKLLISSMKTGYTLRSAEYRLYLERNLDIHDEHSEKGKKDPVEDDSPEMLFGSSPTISSAPGRNDAYCNHEKNDETSHENAGIDILGELSPEVQEYICSLQSRLNSAEKELCDIKRRNTALQMQNFVGEEKNDLLDYLRSLQPEKVKEKGSQMDEPTIIIVESRRLNRCSFYREDCFCDLNSDHTGHNMRGLALSNI